MNGLAVYLGALYGAEPEGSYVELRWRLRHGRGMGRDFHPVRDPRLPELITARGRDTDLYIGVAPRTRQDGTRAAVERCHVLWADCDDPAAVAALEAFQPSPSLVISSGHGRHAYWALWPPIGPDALERANRRLARALGADVRATDAARILRPPGTFNHKGGDPVPVIVERAKVDVYAAADVVAGLADPSEAPRAGTRSLRMGGDTSLDQVSPPVYFERLTGLAPDRDGKVCCPFHEDATPSLHVYETADRGWYCYGCGAGGGVYQLAALLAGYPLPLRGEDFLGVRDVLERRLEAAA